MPANNANQPSESEFALGELRALLGVTQAQVAEQLGTTQPAVLKTERASDPQLSSVRRYIEALGTHLGVFGTVSLAAVIDGTTYPLSVPTPKEEPMRTALLQRLRPRFSSSEESERSTSDVTAWRLRAWDDAFLEQRFLDEQVVAISDDELGSLEEWPGEVELERRLRAHFNDRSAQGISIFVRYWRDFRVDMQVGDIVVVPLSGRRAAIAEVAGPYEYVPTDSDHKMRHRRAVRWLKVMRRDDLDDDLRKVVNAPGTICRFRASDAAHRLRSRAQV